MAEPIRKDGFSDDADYELLPHKEIEDLRQELKKLKGFDSAPGKNLQVSIVELNKKIDKLIAIFEEAMHEVKLEEGGLSFKEKMSPIVDRMQKILEQNSEIADGIVTIGDMIKELKESLAEETRSSPAMQQPSAPFRLPQQLPPAAMGASQPLGPPPSLSPPPLPPRKRTFGL